ncbi:MAG: TldD/PmbA family protein [Phycisphaerae bacterium]|nr:TldD/PmbA family protein [Phycisphaerae bacterium]
MLSESDIRSICQNTIALSPAPATEVRLGVERSALTRLANNEVAQSVDCDQADLTVRVLLGPAGAPTKVGLASTNKLDAAGLRNVVAAATSAAQLQSDDPTLLPPLGPQHYQTVAPPDAATIACSPARRTEPLVAILQRSRREGFECAGAFSTSHSAYAIATSAGLFAFNERTNANLSLTMARDNVSGWSEQTATGVDAIDPAALAERAFDIATRAKSPQPLAAGEYTVVLTPEAVGDLMVFLIVGLMTKAILEGRSFFSGKLGEKVFGENVSFVDDAYHPLAAGLPFDSEGLPRQRVPVIERGVFSHMVHGRETAALAKAQPTGHGLVAPTPAGAMSWNLALQPADATMEQMIASVDHGLLVTHFHYTNMLRPVDLTITGMTRDGLFRIENGKVAQPVNNMRFTESLVHAFNNVAMIGRDLTPLAGWGAGNLVTPAVVIRDFNFSSATEF